MGMHAHIKIGGKLFDIIGNRLQIVVSDVFESYFFHNRIISQKINFFNTENTNFIFLLKKIH